MSGSMQVRWRRRDVVELLEAQHHALEGVFEQILRTTDERKQKALFDGLEESLRILAQIEDEVFYERFKLASSTNEHRRMYLEAREQHRAMELLLDELRHVDPGTETFWAKVKVLEGLLQQHAKHEEQGTFVAARSILEDGQLRELGRELRKRRWELRSEKKGSGEETPTADAVSGWLLR